MQSINHYPIGTYALGSLRLVLRSRCYPHLNHGPIRVVFALVPGARSREPAILTVSAKCHLLALWHSRTEWQLALWHSRTEWHLALWHYGWGTRRLGRARAGDLAGRLPL